METEETNKTSVPLSNLSEAHCLQEESLTQGEAHTQQGQFSNWSKAHSCMASFLYEVVIRWSDGYHTDQI